MSNLNKISPYNISGQNKNRENISLMEIKPNLTQLKVMKIKDHIIY